MVRTKNEILEGLRDQIAGLKDDLKKAIIDHNVAVEKTINGQIEARRLDLGRVSALPSYYVEEVKGGDDDLEDVVLETAEENRDTDVVENEDIENADLKEDEAIREPETVEDQKPTEKSEGEGDPAEATEEVDPTKVEASEEVVQMPGSGI